jgi:hypothetical protein
MLRAVWSVNLLPDEIDAVADAIASAFHAASKIDLHSYLRLDQATRLEGEIAAPLREAIAGALAKIGQLERQLDDGDDDGGEWGEWDAVMDPTQPQPDNAPPIKRLLHGELWQHVADVCFTARGDLRRAERAIRPITASHEERLAACEGAHRKLRRALAAVLEALGRARDRAFPAAAELSAEAEAAAAVRWMYAKFRRSLPACDPGDPQSVRRALRYAAVSIAVMVGCGDFGDVRARDRMIVLALQARVLRWARDGASDAAGARLYTDIVTAADLLRSINLRQELAAYDQQMALEAARALEAAPPAAAIAAALPALHSLRGRDDGLDALVAMALRDPATPEIVAALRAAVAPSPAPADRWPRGGSDELPA